MLSLLFNILNINTKILFTDFLYLPVHTWTQRHTYLHDRISLSHLISCYRHSYLHQCVNLSAASYKTLLNRVYITNNLELCVLDDDYLVLRSPHEVTSIYIVNTIRSSAEAFPDFSSCSFMHSCQISSPLPHQPGRVSQLNVRWTRAIRQETQTGSI